MTLLWYWWTKAGAEMNTLRTAFSRLNGAHSLCCRNGAPSSIFSCSQLRSLSSVLSRSRPEQNSILQGTLNPKVEGAFQQPLWNHQQVRTVKRGTEYQPSNIKRKRTHGWIKRISTPGGIEVILRRMLKGRKSLTHWDSNWTCALKSFSVGCQLCSGAFGFLFKIVIDLRNECHQKAFFKVQFSGSNLS